MTEYASALARLTAFFEALTPQTLPQLAQVYAADARFKDPFNDVQGHAAIIRIFEHMFVKLSEPRFMVLERMAQGEQAFLTWELHFSFARWPAGHQVIRGATHVRFDAAGRVVLHRDYWDAAEELYEKIPLLGALMRALKRAANG
ncbi:nuclear transport factor 2 family protein [Duganella sp. CT11-25]|uniref:nuclear transport factor 2 family protein n=1 Tax=unclassified Duganella TaxID=2636909 RepID=UPI0039B0EC4E